MSRHRTSPPLCAANAWWADPARDATALPPEPTHLRASSSRPPPTGAEPMQGSPWTQFLLDGAESRARVPAAPGRAAHLEPLGAPRLDCGARWGPRSCWAPRKAAVGVEGREICGLGGLKGARSLPPRVPRPPCLIHGLVQRKVRAPCPPDPWRGWAERGHGRCRVL